MFRVFVKPSRVKRLIGKELQDVLESIKLLFEKHNTEYYIIISPNFCYRYPKINKEDFELLCEIFGCDRVYDYSGYNEYTSDVNNYSDIKHFGKFVGWNIMKDIYGGK